MRQQYKAYLMCHFPPVNQIKLLHLPVHVQNLSRPSLATRERIVLLLSNNAFSRGQLHIKLDLTSRVSILSDQRDSSLIPDPLLMNLFRFCSTVVCWHRLELFSGSEDVTALSPHPMSIFIRGGGISGSRASRSGIGKVE